MSPNPLRLRQPPAAPAISARGRDGQAGVTLIETLITLALVAVVAAAVFDMIVGSGRVWRTQNDLSTAQATGRAAMDVLSQDLRQAGYSPLGASFLSVPQGNSTRIQLVADLNGNTIVGTAGEDGENVSYQFVGPAADGTYTLQRGVDLNGNWNFTASGDSIDTIATNVVQVDTNGDGTNEPFFAYDQAPPATSRVTVSFGIQSTYKDPLKKTYPVVKFSDTVSLRNHN